MRRPSQNENVPLDLEDGIDSYQTPVDTRRAKNPKCSLSMDKSSDRQPEHHYVKITRIGHVIRDCTGATGFLQPSHARLTRDRHTPGPPHFAVFAYGMESRPRNPQ